MKGLRRCREAAGMSQPELAAALGLTRAAVSSWETGTSLPSADRLPDIARALGCSIDELFRAGASDDGISHQSEDWFENGKNNNTESEEI